jgi:hypothetical protein
MKSRRPAVRLLVPLVVAAVAGACIAAVGRALGLAPATTYAVAGAVLAVIVMWGLSYARAGRPVAPWQSLARQHIEVMQPDVTAVATDDGDEAISPPYRLHREVVGDRLQEGILSAEDPVVDPAGRAGAPSTFRIELGPDLIEVGHGNGNGSPGTLVEKKPASRRGRMKRTGRRGRRSD